MNEAARFALAPANLPVYTCLALVWLALAFATHLAHARLRAEIYVRYWSLAWFCAFVQLALLLVISSLGSVFPQFALKFFLLPIQTFGFLQPVYIAIAAFSIRREPSANSHVLAFVGCFLAAILSLLWMSRLVFSGELEMVRSLLTSRLFILAAANLWFAFAYLRRAENSSSGFRYAIPLPCVLQAIHLFFLGLNQLTGASFYFAVTSPEAAVVAVLIGLSMVIALFVDLTDAAQRNNAAKSLFLSTMTHELRTPLAGMIGLTSILSNSKNEAEQKELASSIGQCASSVLALVDDILDVARIESGRTQATPIAFSPTLALSEILSMLQTIAAEKGILLQTVYDSPLPDQVRCDPVFLRRILLNLVGNALKFTDNGSVTIRTSYTNNKLNFAVEDTGSGIPAEDLPQLMQQFFQASNAVSASSKGTGLGLHLSQHMVQLMGGAGIEVRSILGQGSTFAFSVPAPEADPLPSSDARVDFATNSLRVLVAEDNKVNQLVMVRLPEKLGHSAILATDGLQAVELAQREAPDLILMDYRMPILDGPAAAREIRAMERGHRHVPIIAITANALVEHRDLCLAAGMDDYLSKPVTLQQLANAIERSIVQTS
jgi:signal transduction histidine kinase/CheY-like chemotaxis protein